MRVALNSKKNQKNKTKAKKKKTQTNKTKNSGCLFYLVLKTEEGGDTILSMRLFEEIDVELI